MSEPTLITFGCRLNIAESEAMRALAQGQDEPVRQLHDEGADLVGK